jgi:SAM-dependent methyltransferase
MLQELSRAGRGGVRALAPEFLLASFDFLSQKRRAFRPRLLPGPVRTLDVGCGGGNWSVLAWRLGNRVTGVDTNRTDLAEAARLLAAWQVPDGEVKFLFHDARALAELDGAYDQALCFEVIEHIRDHTAVLRGIRARLKSGGRLLLSVPNSERRHLYGEVIDEHEAGGHVRWGYGRGELSALLAEAGFQAIEVVGYGGCFTQRATEASRWLVKTLHVPPAAAFLALYPFTALDGLTRCAPFSWFAVAEKP